MFGSKGDSDSSKALSLTKCCVEVFLLDPPSELSESELELLDSENSDALEDDEYRRENLVRLFLPLWFWKNASVFWNVFAEPPNGVQHLQFFSVLPPVFLRANYLAESVQEPPEPCPQLGLQNQPLPARLLGQTNLFKQFFYERRKVNCIR